MKNIISKNCLIVLFTLMILSGCGGAGGNGGNENNNGGVVDTIISGTVLDVSGAPIDNAEVIISGTPPVTITTSANGEFSAVVVTGSYSIDIKVAATTIYNSNFTCNGNTCDLGNIESNYCNFTGWKKHLKNPIFSSSGPVEWDNPLRGGTVLKDDDEPVNKYKRWYVGGTTSFDEGMSIGYATSSDGISWVPYSNNPVMTHGNTWDINGFSGISVIKDGSIYKLWYEGVDTNGVNQIGYATSSDGINWIPDQNNPVFSPGVNGSWDDDDVGNPWIIKEASIYKMWYWGDNQVTNTDQIGLATSTNGVSWQRSVNNPVLSSDTTILWENGEGVGSPKVIKNTSGYTMSYHGANQSGTLRIGFATSSDGIIWSKDNNNPLVDIASDSTWDSVAIAPETLIDGLMSLKLWFLGADNSGTVKVGLAVTCN